MRPFTTNKKKQQVIELFLCSDDRRLKTIASTLQSSPNTVSNIIQEYFDGAIEFERGNYKILHSSINN